MRYDNLWIIFILCAVILLLFFLLPQKQNNRYINKIKYFIHLIQTKKIARQLAIQQQESERVERERKECEKKRIQIETAESMKRHFLQQNPYVAFSDWQKQKTAILEVCPFFNFDNEEIIRHNKYFREQQLIEHKEYFDSLLTYPLDEQQREAIVTLGENVLVVAAAGSGKTSTIVAKTHYLVNKMHVDPRNILVVTYTRKAADELQMRVGVSAVECTTFHKHAIDTIASIEGEKPTICDSNLIMSLFDAFFRSSASFASSFLLFQTVQKTLLQYDYEYSSYKEYLKALSEYGKMAPYRDMDNNICYVKSRQEMEIMVILTELGLHIRYEEKYPIPIASTKYRQYRPDFTIHYTKEDGVEKTIYLEHYAIDENGRVPAWFGDGKRGGWAKANHDYIDGMHWKQQVHADNGTILIYTTSADFYDGITSARKRIITLLQEQGIPFRPLSTTEKTQKMAIPLNRSIESLVKLIAGFIVLIKANGRTITDLLCHISNASNQPYNERNSFILRHLVQPIYEKYQETLKINHELDFTDCLLHATELLKKKQIYNYEYILVDEFQDMSTDKYLYLSALRRDYPRTRIFCVGDDWQSIYRFSGSDIRLFSQFEAFNGVTEELKIEATHRFGEPLLSRSSEFILRNPAQKKKVLRPDKDKITYLAFAGYDDEKNERHIIEKQIARLPKDTNIYILSRYRYDIGNLFPEVANMVNGERGGGVELNIAGRKIQALTAHSCKGLEADYVFLINCSSGYDDYGFPSQVADDPIMEYALSRSDTYEHAEERRLFYVAITRARRATYVLYDNQYPSLFVVELGGLQTTSIHPKWICPRCGVGNVMYSKDGYARNGHFYTVLRCTNKACDLQSSMKFFNSYEIMSFEEFLTQRQVTSEEYKHIRITNCAYFVSPVLHIPCAQSSPLGLYVTIDPRYERYDLQKFYTTHLHKGDLAISIQRAENTERLLLTLQTQHGAINEF